MTRITRRQFAVTAAGVVANAADFVSLSKQSLTLLPFVTARFVSGARACR
jgi:hypothetical protein